LDRVWPPQQNLPTEPVLWPQTPSTDDSWWRSDTM